MTTYTTYMTWTALSHEPDDVCNPKGYLISGYNEANGLTVQSILTGIMGFAMLVYAGFRPETCTSQWSMYSFVHSNRFAVLMGKMIRIRRLPKRK